MDVIVRDMTLLDWPRVAAIYRLGIETGVATFETTVPPDAAFRTQHLEKPRLVAVADGKVAGWVALSPVSARPVYRGVGEVSIYVDPQYQQRGIGTRLMMEVQDASEREGIWTLQSQIFQENEASLCLHTRCGFRTVGVREMLGRDCYGDWHDVVLMEWRNTIGKKRPKDIAGA